MLVAVGALRPRASLARVLNREHGSISDRRTRESDRKVRFVSTTLLARLVCSAHGARWLRRRQYIACRGACGLRKWRDRRWQQQRQRRSWRQRRERRRHVVG